MKSRLGRILSFKNIAVFFFVANFLVFLAYPIAKAFAGSLHYWNPMTGAYDWVGLENFVSILTDPLFWQSMWNTFYFSFFAVVFRIALGLGIAVMLWSQLAKCKTAFRTLFYMPTITPLVAVSLVWVWMYDPQFGLIDKLFGVHINWLNDPQWALPAIIIMTVWKDFGYATVLYLAALMNVPVDVLEASQIDGANGWQRFWHIIMPLIRPTTMFVFITSLITYFQAYVQILMMTEGGPGNKTYTISYLIYDRAFVNYDFGTASAMSVVLFVITGVLSFVSLRLSSRKD
ncbi:sugar ABC transporter permease [Bifidobacterium lemurum]|nr:sugar ABC transporter permease [Bifidobacterium lemurum]QOL35437.1 sugar ABC transporter permease [Bifidobacterium lemurum]